MTSAQDLLTGACKPWAALAATLLLAACAAGLPTHEPMGQFFAGRNSSPGVEPLEGGMARALADPSDTLVMVFNHGTDWGGRFQDCRPGTMPDFIKRWTGHGLAGRKVVAFYLCAQVTEDWFAMGRGRARENEAVLDRLIAAGVDPRNIFVFGHSGGASASLMLAERAPKKFNSIVVSAPGYGFAWLDAEGENYPWMDSEYDKWRSRLSRAEDMSGLVFLYDGDIYAPPAQAQFLSAHAQVEVVNIHDDDADGQLCSDEPEAHFYWWSFCFRRDWLDHVESFVAERLEERVWLE